MSFVTMTFLSIYLIRVLGIHKTDTHQSKLNHSTFDNTNNSNNNNSYHQHHHPYGHRELGHNDADDTNATRSHYFDYPVSGRAWRFMLVLFPLLLASYVAISRTQQYVHHPTDVLAGCLLGVVVAVVTHKYYITH